jgi:hypothetical protein
LKSMQYTLGFSSCALNHAFRSSGLKLCTSKEGFFITVAWVAKFGLCGCRLETEDLQALENLQS